MFGTRVRFACATDLRGVSVALMTRLKSATKNNIYPVSVGVCDSLTCGGGHGRERVSMKTTVRRVSGKSINGARATDTYRIVGAWTQGNFRSWADFHASVYRHDSDTSRVITFVVVGQTKKI